MKKTINEIYNPPSSIAKVAAKAGITASSPSNFMDYVDLLAQEDPCIGTPLDRAMKKEARNILSTTGQEQLVAAFRLGNIDTYRYLIRQEENKSKVNGSADKSKKWASDLADQLIKDYPIAKHEERWKKILTSKQIDQSKDIKPLEIFRDGDTLCARDRNGHEESIKKSTFITRYLSRARERAQKPT